MIWLSLLKIEFIFLVGMLMGELGRKNDSTFIDSSSNWLWKMMMCDGLVDDNVAIIVSFLIMTSCLLRLNSFISMDPVDDKIGVMVIPSIALLKK